MAYYAYFTYNYIFCAYYSIFYYIFSIFLFIFCTLLRKFLWSFLPCSAVGVHMMFGVNRGFKLFSRFTGGRPDQRPCALSRADHRDRSIYGLARPVVFQPSLPTFPEIVVSSFNLVLGSDLLTLQYPRGRLYQRSCSRPIVRIWCLLVPAALEFPLAHFSWGWITSGSARCCYCLKSKQRSTQGSRSTSVLCFCAGGVQRPAGKNSRSCLAYFACYDCITFSDLCIHSMGG
jgi:hypothetical protein